MPHGVALLSVGDSGASLYGTGGNANPKTHCTYIQDLQMFWGKTPVTKALAGRGSREICEDHQMRHTGGTFDVAIVMYFMNDCIVKRGGNLCVRGCSPRGVGTV